MSERRQRQQSENVAKLIASASSSLSLRQVCAEVCEAALGMTIGDTVSVFVFDDDKHFRPVAARGHGGIEELKAFLNPPADVLASPEIQRFNQILIKRRKPIIIEDVPASGSGNKWWIKTFGIKSCAYYPLRTKNKIIGFMAVAMVEEKRKFPQEEINALASIGKQAAVIIENARLYERERRQRQQSENVAKLLASVSSTLSLRQVCVEVCEAALGMTVGDTVSVFVFDDEERFRPVAAIGPGGREELEAFQNPPAEVQATPEIQYFNRILRKIRKPIVFEDLTQAGSGWWTNTFNLKSFVYYPLRTKSKIIGFMTVAAVEEKRKFPREEIDTLASIARQAAVIIENARLYEQQQEQRQRAEALVNVLTAGGSTLEPEESARRALSDAVVDISVADRCSIFMMTERRHSPGTGHVARRRRPRTVGEVPQPASRLRERRRSQGSCSRP